MPANHASTTALPAIEHWLVRAAKTADIPGANGLSLDARSSAREAWSTALGQLDIPSVELAAAVADFFRTSVADLGAAEATASKLLPASVARQLQVFPLRCRGRHLVLATADPTDVAAERAIGFASGRTPRMEIAPPSELEAAIEDTYSPTELVQTFIDGMDLGAEGLVEIVEKRDEDEEVSAEEVASEPVARLTKMIFHSAAQQGASDIHIQPVASGGVVRLRIDGVLRTAMQLPLPVLGRIISRIKVMAGLDIADRYQPQDGRAEVIVSGKKYDLRVSTVPTRHSEKAVIRVLDPTQAGSLDGTGIPDAELSRLRRLLTGRDGIFVVTGPTGSGKTTTMYAALCEIATEDVNIMTVEDPVEYELDGLTQIQVARKRGVTFASALRAILRQDPDVIFVGEIRDLETAEMAVQASLTGHLVLATMHTNDAIGSVRRLTDLGLDTRSIADTLRGALAQRLVRRVCRDCAVPVHDPLTEDEARLSELFGLRPVVRAMGCQLCGQVGYKGRFPVIELFAISPELQRGVAAGTPLDELTVIARSEGMRTLREAGLDRIRSGETTLEELERTLGDRTDADAGDGAKAEMETEAIQVPPRPRVSVAIAPGSEATPTGYADDDASPSLPPMFDPVADAAREVDEDGEAMGPTAMVVDDDPGLRQTVRTLLEQMGFRVSEAGDGVGAIKLLASGDPCDLLVLDVEMPRLDGHEVLKEVRGTLSTAGLPVIVLTGAADLTEETEFLESGADDYLTKPIEPARFKSRVRATLRRAAG